MLKRLNDVLPSLVATIIVFGVIVELIGVWFVEDKIRYSSGLWIGIGCAVFMAINMSMAIEDAVSAFSEKESKRKIIVSAVFRYVVVFLLLTLTFYFNIGSVFPALIGVMGLKIGAYAQPLIEKLRKKNKEEEGGEVN